MIPALGPLALALLAATPAQDARPIQLAQLTVREQIIIRVPARPRAPDGRGGSVQWSEAKKGPKCVAVRAIAGATLLGRDSVDLILRDNSRVRARLERSCPALDYYHGFYIAPQEDGKVCAGRDVIRSRSGGNCRIDRFRQLDPKRDD